MSKNQPNGESNQNSETSKMRSFGTLLLGIAACAGVLKYLFSEMPYMAAQEENITIENENAKYPNLSFTIARYLGKPLAGRVKVLKHRIEAKNIGGCPVKIKKIQVEVSRHEFSEDWKRYLIQAAKSESNGNVNFTPSEKTHIYMYNRDDIPWIHIENNDREFETETTLQRQQISPFVDDSMIIASYGPELIRYKYTYTYVALTDNDESEELTKEVTSIIRNGPVPDGLGDDYGAYPYMAPCEAAEPCSAPIIDSSESEFRNVVPLEIKNVIGEALRKVITP